MTWIRKHKKYKRPKKPFDKQRIEEEGVLIRKYGLKNKREIWKAEAAINKIRRRAKKLITAEKEEQEKLFEKLNKVGFMVEKIPDVLALTKEDWLKRRLQSVVVEKKFVKSPKQARQLIVHKHIRVNGRIVNRPSYQVKINDEDKISFVEKRQKKTKEKEESKNKKTDNKNKIRQESAGKKENE